MPKDEVRKKHQYDPIFQMGKRYLSKRLQATSSPKAFIGALSTKQRRELRKLRWRTYLIAAIIGAAFVLLVILPYHYSDWFGEQHIELFGRDFQVELYYNVYALVMVLPEIMLLHILNLSGVRKMCEILQVPSVDDEQYEEQIALLTEAGLEIPDRHMRRLGVDPYAGLPKLSYYFLFLLAKGKAFLTNMAAKIILRRFLGRYALRIVMDLVGAPVYAFWDAWASHVVLKEAQMRIVSNVSSRHFLKQFTPEELDSVKGKLPLLINFIAQQKRKYNFALYTYIFNLSDRMPGMNLKIKRRIHWKELLGQTEEEDLIMARLMIFGFIVDGILSMRERITLRELGREEWFPLSVTEIEKMLRRYVEGKEMEQKSSTLV